MKTIKTRHDYCHVLRASDRQLGGSEVFFFLFYLENCTTPTSDTTIGVFCVFTHPSRTVFMEI